MNGSLTDLEACAVCENERAEIGPLCRSCHGESRKTVADRDLGGLGGWAASEGLGHRDLRAGMFGKLPDRVVVPARRVMTMEEFALCFVVALALLVGLILFVPR